VSLAKEDRPRFCHRSGAFTASGTPIARRRLSNQFSNPLTFAQELFPLFIVSPIYERGFSPEGLP
jgi:hypothetical protein